MGWSRTGEDYRHRLEEPGGVIVRRFIKERTVFLFFSLGDLRCGGLLFQVWDRTHVNYFVKVGFTTLEVRRT